MRLKVYVNRFDKRFSHFSAPMRTNAMDFIPFIEFVLILSGLWQISIHYSTLFWFDFQFTFYLAFFLGGESDVEVCVSVSISVSRFSINIDIFYEHFDVCHPSINSANKKLIIRIHRQPYSFHTQWTELLLDFHCVRNMNKIRIQNLSLVSCRWHTEFGWLNRKRIVMTKTSLNDDNKINQPLENRHTHHMHSFDMMIIFIFGLNLNQNKDKKRKRNYLTHTRTRAK